MPRHHLAPGRDEGYERQGPKKAHAWCDNVIVAMNQQLLEVVQAKNQNVIACPDGIFQGGGLLSDGRVFGLKLAHKVPKMGAVQRQEFCALKSAVIARARLPQLKPSSRGLPCDQNALAGHIHRACPIENVGCHALNEVAALLGYESMNPVMRVAVKYRVLGTLDNKTVQRGNTRAIQPPPPIPEAEARRAQRRAPKT
ncbi:hypothetical protein [Bradyrhizobium sp. USDA 10063]